MRLLPIILFLSIYSFALAQDYKLKEYSIGINNFAISFPFAPTKEVSELDSEQGTVYTYFYYCTPNIEDEIDSNSLYMASCVDFPDNSLKSDSPEEIDDLFTRMIRNGVQNVDGEILYVKDISTSEIPARQVKVLCNKKSLGGKNVARIRYLLVKDIVYILQTITKPPYDNNLYIDTFMNSFKFLEKPDYIKINTIKKL